MRSSREKSKWKIWRGAGILSAAAICGKLIGALYKVPLARVLTSHGMGMYQSVFPMYALLITITGGGVTAAVSKLTAENDGKFDVTGAVICALIFSVPITFIAAALAKFVATAAGAPGAALGFAVLVISVPLSSASAVLRGYFQGSGEALCSAVGQIIEQSVKLAAGLTLAALLAKVSLTAAVTGCAAGVTVAEGISTLYYFRRHRKGVRAAKADTTQDVAAQNTERVFFGIETLTEISSEFVPTDGVVIRDEERAEKRSLRSLFFAVFGAALPITLGLMVLPLCQVADSFVIVNLLVRGGMDGAYATSLYGLVTGPVSALANMPAVFTVGVSGALLPKVSSLVRRGEELRGTVAKVTIFSAVTGLVFCAGLIVFAPLALRVLYGSSLGVPLSLAVKLLRYTAAVVPLIAIMQTASAVLQGAGKSYVPVLNLALAAVVKETLNFILLPRVGILGFVIATVTFYALACMLSLVALVRLSTKKNRALRRGV